MSEFQLVAPFQPAGDQPQRLSRCCAALKRESGIRCCWVTGSGKTFTMANVIAN